jgi:glutamine synthetase
VNENIWEMSHREKRRLAHRRLPHDLNEALDELEKDDVITARWASTSRRTSSKRSGRSGGTTSRR